VAHQLAAPGFAGRPGQLRLTTSLTRINFLAMFFLALAIFATAYLQALQRCVAPAIAPLVFNVVTIAGTVWLGPRLGIVGLAVAWVAGAAAQFLAQIPALHRQGLRYRLTIDWRHPAIRTVGRLALPAMFGLAVVEINAYVGRFFASLLPATPGVNAVAALDYAFEVVQAPVGILAISVATVLFPGMSQIAATGDRVKLSQTTSLGLRSLLFLVLPVSAAFVVFAVPLVGLVFQRGEFGPAATAAVAACLAAYAAGLVPMAAYYVITRTFYALHDMRTPVAIGVAMVGLNAILDYVLCRSWGCRYRARHGARRSSTWPADCALRRRVGGLDGRRAAFTLCGHHITGAAPGRDPRLAGLQAGPASATLQRLFVSAPMGRPRSPIWRRVSTRGELASERPDPPALTGRGSVMDVFST
jgi:putative peptidoglycan lipid II flippase